MNECCSHAFGRLWPSLVTHISAWIVGGGVTAAGGGSTLCPNRACTNLAGLIEAACRGLKCSAFRPVRLLPGMQRGSMGCA